MPVIIGLLIVVATIYQLFFRYESWESNEKPGLIYEHDNLTGETQIIKPGSRMSVFARILGKGAGGNGTQWDDRYIEPFDHPGEKPGSIASTSPTTRTESSTNSTHVNLQDPQQVEKVARPVPIPREVVIASSAPPVPGGPAQALSQAENMNDNAPPFAVRQVDLDQDGSIEEIIQNATQSDGLLDISIVKNGREIFYGRGKQISLLPTRNQGWADIALKMGAKTLQVFRYDIKNSAYRALDEKG
ncbi:MAG: hypothetical protein K0Q50_1329 [Vampirovibrio sp.]|jgi:hypothetical protein|nr:hypothetical protein [Vampirovibrio sp.]